MAPRMDFSPSLGSTTTIPLPHITSKYVKFNFTVTLSKYWADRFVEEGRQVQVWSDIPSSTHRSSGDWYETPFVPKDALPAQSAESSNPNQPLYSLSVISPDHTSADENRDPTISNPDKVTLVAEFAIPQELTQYGARYAFTFRIAGPYGNVEWLGNMGWNGHLWIGSRVGFGSTDEYEAAWSTPALDAPEVSSATWSRRELTEVCIGNFEGVEMKGWSFSPEGPARIASLTSASTRGSLFILHPEGSSASASPLYEKVPSLIISSDTPSSLRIENSRLYASASSVKVWEPELSSELETTLSALVSTATLGGYEVALAPQDGRFLVVVLSPTCSGELLVPASAAPKTLFLVPTISQDSASTVGVPFELIRSIQPRAESIGLASFVSGDLLQVNPSTESVGDIAVLVGSDGGDLIILPMFMVPNAKPSEVEAVSQTVVGIVEPSMVTSVKIIDRDGQPNAADELIDTTPAEENLEIGDAMKLEVSDDTQPDEYHADVSEDTSGAIDLGSAEQDVAPVNEGDVQKEPQPEPANSSAEGLSGLTKSPIVPHLNVLSFDVLLWLAVLLSVVRTLVVRLESVIPPSVLPHLQRALPQEREAGPPETMNIDEEPEVVPEESEAPPAEKKVADNPRLAEIITPPLTPPRSRQSSLLAQKDTPVINPSIPEEVLKIPSYALSFVLPPNANDFKILLVNNPNQDLDLDVEVDGKDVLATREEFKGFSTHLFQSTSKTEGVVSVSVL